MPNHLLPSTFNRNLNHRVGLTTMPRAVGRATEAMRHQGIVAAAHVQAASHVTSTAMQELGVLTVQEAIMAEQYPHAQGRFAALVDGFTAVALRDIARMGA